MKKNYILFLLITLVFYTANSQTVLFDQPRNGDNGIISDNTSDGTASVYSADDFSLTATSNIDIITAYGFQSAGDFETFVTGIDVFIYADAAGVPDSNPTLPGTGLLELVNIDPAGGAITIVPSPDPMDPSYDIVIDVTAALGSTLSLGAGTYWLVIAPYVDNLSAGARWNWFQATDGTLSETHLIDPGDLFGAGATSWTTLTTLGLSFNSTAFKIEENILSVDEFALSSVSIRSNPIKDIINIELHSSITEFNSELFSITGQLVMKNSNMTQFDISNLNSGLYMLRISTDNGTVTKRIVKE
ncbi:hypothetical protein A9Q87_05070 [Flavobacteriales bacterium 34_180_T64]|nr:hypothetical protein A9Q87_05070 [Flavobacteriales bacterium 34_180_T64]